MSIVSNMLWLSATVLVILNYSVNHRGVEAAKTHNNPPHNPSIPQAPPVVTNVEPTVQLQGDSDHGTTNALKALCKRLCSSGSACPPECSEVYLDPWTIKADISGDLKSKRRSNSMDGLTFEDYLFMRWLGRDISRRRLN